MSYFFWYSYRSACVIINGYAYFVAFYVVDSILYQVVFFNPDVLIFFAHLNFTDFPLVSIDKVSVIVQWYFFILYYQKIWSYRVSVVLLKKW